MELYVISNGLLFSYLSYDEFIKYNINLDFIVAYKVVNVGLFHGEENVLMFSNLKTGEVRFLSPCGEYHMAYKPSQNASIWVQEYGSIDKYYEELDKLGMKILKK